MTNNILTRSQREFLDFITKSREESNFPPTIPEIQKKFSFRSPTAASDHLNALERKGYISRHPHKSRGLEVIIDTSGKKNNGNNNSVEIPIVGRVAAGMPILAEQNFDGTISVDKYLVRHPENYFALKVEGDSMKNAGILHGDYVIIQHDAYIDEGDIVVAVIDNEATVKRYFKEKNKIILQPEHDVLKPIVVDPKEKEVIIAGKVRGVIRRM